MMFTVQNANKMLHYVDTITKTPQFLQSIYFLRYMYILLQVSSSVPNNTRC